VARIAWNEAHVLLKSQLDALWKTCATPVQQEFRFHPTRKWLFDFALVDERIAIEIQGAIWKGRAGGHTSGKGMQRDMDKRNAGVALGWRVLTFSTDDVLSGRAKEFIRKLLIMEQCGRVNSERGSE
jgi:very-short-patch-repair endonuclease